MKNYKVTWRIGTRSLLMIALAFVLALSVTVVIADHEQASKAGPQAGITPTVIAYPTYQSDPASRLGAVAPPNATAIAISQRVTALAPLFYSDQGIIIAQGTNTGPAGLRNLKSYRLEEIRLAAARTLSVQVPSETGFEERTVTVDRVWRFTIVGGPFHEGGGDPLTVWLDGAPTGVAGHDGQDLKSLIYDPALLHEGATIGVGLGLDEESRDTFSMKLHLTKSP